mgnify:CR=1 FL=1
MSENSVRISVLPSEYRFQVINKIKAWLSNHRIDSVNKVINTRNPNVAHEQIVQDAESYIDYLENADDESFRLPALMDYLHKLLDLIFLNNKIGRAHV